MNSSYTLTYVDRADKLAQITFTLPLITAANHDATVNVSIDALMDATNTLSRGNLINRSLLHSVVKSAREIPADVDARRSSAVQVHFTYLDGNNDITPAYVTIPVADWGAFSFPAGVSVIQRSDFNVAEEAFADAMETYTESPDGTAVTVTKMVAVGKA